jgi:hypothetical protein
MSIDESQRQRFEEANRDADTIERLENQRDRLLAALRDEHMESTEGGMDPKCHVCALIREIEEGT